MSKTSPTQRTLAECRKRGWIAQVVEHTVPRVFIKRDLFGVIDVVAVVPQGMCRPDALGLCAYCCEVVDLYCKPCGARKGGILGIQATSGSNHASRVTKVLEEPRAIAWVKAGGLLQVWSWSKRREPGKKREVWLLRAEELVVRSKAA